jgi:hypothetical protein
MDIWQNEENQKEGKGAANQVLPVNRCWDFLNYDGPLWHYALYILLV